jgi:hypothetical protein
MDITLITKAGTMAGTVLGTTADMDFVGTAADMEFVGTAADTTIDPAAQILID